MSSIIGKEFQNKTNGDTIKVVSIDGNIAILENDQRISVERLLDGNHYGESIVSPNEFINESININSGGLHSQLLNQIKGLDENSINNANNHGGDTQIGGVVNPVESHMDAQRKLHGENVYIDSENSEQKAMIEKAKQDQMGLESKMRKQAAKVGKVVDGIEEEVIMPVNRNLEGVQVEGQRETSVKMVEDVGSSITNTAQPQNIQQVNPMFTKMKRTKKVALKIDIEEMMPSKELLKMLEDGFEDSVLDYLTEEIAGKVLSDATIKSQIKQKLHEYVYGKPRKKQAVKKTTPSKKKAVVKKAK